MYSKMCNVILSKFYYIVCIILFANIFVVVVESDKWMVYNDGLEITWLVLSGIRSGFV